MNNKKLICGLSIGPFQPFSKWSTEESITLDSYSQKYGTDRYEYIKSKASKQYYDQDKPFHYFAAQGRDKKVILVEMPTNFMKSTL